MADKTDSNSDIESFWEGIRPQRPKPKDIGDLAKEGYQLGGLRLGGLPVMNSSTARPLSEMVRGAVGVTGITGSTGPVGAQGYTGPPPGLNGPHGPTGPTGVILPSRYGAAYHSIDFETECEGFLAHATHYQNHPILHARYIYDQFSGICIYGCVNHQNNVYEIIGRRHGYGNVYAIEHSIAVEQLQYPPPEMALNLLRQAFENGLHELLMRPTQSLLENFR
jgi:hypothetical protein